MRNKLFFLPALCLLLASALSAIADDRSVITIDGRDVTVEEFRYLYAKNQTESSTVSSPREYARLYALFKMKVMEAEACGIDTTMSFKNELESYYASIPTDDTRLRNEYREGMLLFEISNRKVWQKSVNDVDGLANHFDANRKNYTFDDPRAKGWMIFAHNTETACDVCHYLDNLDFVAEDIRPAIKDKFGREVMAVKFLVKEGVNQLIDALVFRRDVAYAPVEGWETAQPFRFKIISEPEEWRDVKSSVISDYQQLLADEWEQELWKTHSVVFHYDVIDEISEL